MQTWHLERFEPGMCCGLLGGEWRRYKYDIQSLPDGKHKLKQKDLEHPGSKYFDLTGATVEMVGADEGSDAAEEEPENQPQCVFTDSSNYKIKLRARERGNADFVAFFELLCQKIKSTKAEEEQSLLEGGEGKKREQLDVHVKSEDEMITVCDIYACAVVKFEYDMETQTNLKRYLEVKAERKQKLKDEGIRLNENSAEMEEYRTKEERQLVEDALGKAKVEVMALVRVPEVDEEVTGDDHQIERDCQTLFGKNLQNMKQFFENEKQYEGTGKGGLDVAIFSVVDVAKLRETPDNNFLGPNNTHLRPDLGTLTRMLYQPEEENPIGITLGMHKSGLENMEDGKIALVCWHSMAPADTEDPVKEIPKRGMLPTNPGAVHSFHLYGTDDKHGEGYMCGFERNTTPEKEWESVEKKTRYEQELLELMRNAVENSDHKQVLVSLNENIAKYVDNILPKLVARSATFVTNQDMSVLQKDVSADIKVISKQRAEAAASKRRFWQCIFYIMCYGCPVLVLMLVAGWLYNTLTLQ